MSTPQYFPPPELAQADGLVGVGGKLTTAWLLDAYRHGIFPWPVQGVVAWWSPDPRAIIELDGLRVPRRLARTCRSGRFRISRDTEFRGVIEACGAAAGRKDHTWITPDIIAAYCRLHRQGHAHSVEVWQGDELAGGTYGVALGGYFAAESMFYSVRDASKVALVHLVEWLSARGFVLLDIQQLTSHTERMGATEILRSTFLNRLRAALALPVRFTENG